MTALLRAMAEKLIPGLPESLNIAILQQTDDDDTVGELTGSTATMTVSDDTAKKVSKTVLQQVMQSDTARNDVTRKIKRMYLSPLKSYCAFSVKTA